MESLSDEEMMRRIAQGDRQAFAELVERHRGGAMRLAYGMTRSRAAAEDIVQESFLRVWTRACHWDASKGSFLAWFRRITTNLAIDQSRRVQPDPLDEALELASDRPDAEHQLASKRIGQRLDGALRALPERQRQAFVLCAIEHLGNGQAASMLDVSIGTIEQLLVRAKRKLRTALADLMEGS